MDLNKFIKNNLLGLKVIPHSGRTELKEDNGKLKLYLKSAPEKGKANTELIKFFKKNHQLSVRIKSGESSREKVIEVMR
ncbi:DUF167 domain-containing protein [Candidatus Woesearchaeota archaeon]|nr:DUF167 domain-containing protein [Candidatus Woesearchaeota archaeon]MBI2582514.1 DUF167 domain-containing protein [Candidatus Woesearchaeota archaeon]